MVRTYSSKDSDMNEMEEEHDPEDVGTRSLRRSRREDEDEATVHEATCSKRAKVIDLEKAQDDNVGASVMAPKEFQQILKEGKAERKQRAEEKRLKGLRQIEEGKSKTGVDPLDQFPEVVWKGIANELTPSDKANLWEVHPFFHEILASNRIRDILFPQVLDQRTSFIEGYYEDARSNSRSPLFELRLVSKCIRDAIDKWFETDFRSSGMAMLKESTAFGWKSYDSDYMLHPSVAPVEFSVEHDESALNKILEIKKPMRIFRRSLSISFQFFDEDDISDDEGQIGQRLRYFNLFQYNMTQALEQIGDQIWRLFLYPGKIEKHGLSPAQFYSILRDWLQLLPNLKLIKIWSNERSHENEESELIGQSLLTGQPFPTLPALEGFEFDAVKGDNIWSVCDAIIAANPHIKMFISDPHPSIIQYLTQSRPQLMKLEICLFGYPDDPVSFNLFFPICPPSNWNIRRMDLSLLSFCGFSMNLFIKFLNYFPSLEVVILEIDEITFSKKPIDYLQLPNLIHFGLEFGDIERREYDSRIHFFFSLQFLLHSRKLESIEWIHSAEGSLMPLVRQIDLYTKSLREETLDFGGGFMDLNNSNLWNAFPKLEHIHVRGDWMDVDEHLRKYRSSSKPSERFHRCSCKDKWS